MRFMVKASFKEPPTEEVQALIPEELARVKELTEQGLIADFYVAANGSTVWAVWNCESRDELEAEHKTLPLDSYFDTTVTLLSD